MKPATLVGASAGWAGRGEQFSLHCRLMDMNFPSLRVGLALTGLVAAFGATACVYSEPGYGYGSYDSVPSGYYSSSSYSGGGYSGGPRYFPALYGRGYRHDDDRHRHGHADHGDGRIRLTDPGSRHDGRDRPEGWHSREWFQRRGYNTSSDRFEDRAGHRFGRGESHRESARRDRHDHH